MADYLDSVRLWFEHGLMSKENVIGILGEKMVNWDKNCEKLKDYLNCRIGGIVGVSHYPIGDVEYFVVKFFSKNVFDSERRIGNALNINRNYVRMVGLDCCGNQVDLIESDAVFEEWGNPLSFRRNWLSKHMDDGRLPSVVSSRLDECCFDYNGVFKDFTFRTLYIKSPCVNRETKVRLSRILGVPEYTMGILYDDEEEYWDGSGWFYIDLDKVKEDAR